MSMIRPLSQTLIGLLGTCVLGCSPTDTTNEWMASRPALPSMSSPTPLPTVSGLSVEPATPVSPLPLLLPTQGNLIDNPGAEQLNTNGLPVEWEHDFWGKLKAEFKLESHDALSGQHYLSTHVSNYEEGDAKWQFTAKPLVGNRWYEYSEYYRADGRNRLLVTCQTPSGQRYFQNVWQSHTSPVWQKVTFRFYTFPEQSCTSSIIHVVDRNGWLHSDHHQLQEVAGQPLKRPLISITFDDIWATAANEGAQELLQRGMKGSYYFVSRFTLNPQNQYADTRQLKALIKAGHEVGSHSFNHRAMSTLETAPLIHEFRANIAWLQDFGVKAKGIAYPFGDFSDKVEVEAPRFHQYTRTSLVGLNDRTANRYRLRILPVTSSTTTAELKIWVDAAERTSTWLILLFHDLKDGQGDFNYTTSLQQYKEVLTYIQAKKLVVLPVDEALKEL